MAKLKTSSTQSFTGIKEIVGDVAIFSKGSACLIFEITATNFSLLSPQEQDAKIAAFSALLNSLSYPIQIAIRSKRLDISSYLRLLDDEVLKNPNQKLAQQVQKYRNFVAELVKVNTILDKKFYIVLPFTHLENPGGSSHNFKDAARASLHSKASSLSSQLSRLNLRSRILQNEELMKLFYDIYNEEGTGNMSSRTGAVADIVSPSSIEVDFNSIRIGERFYKTYFVSGYPRFVSPNWLSPLINFEHSMMISMFIYPSSSSDVLSDLRRKIAEMEATISSEIDDGREMDPKVKASLEDALSVQEQLAKGVERFFQFSLYVTLSSQNKKDLDEAGRRLETTLSSMLMTGKSATLQMEEGFKSSIPQGTDSLYLPRNMDTTSLSTTFPFTSAMLAQDKGIMYGENLQNGSLVIFDRFSLENANEVVFGKSGAGKSYLIKLEVMRQFMFGTEVIIIDPEGEYEEIAKTLEGEYVTFKPNEPIKINPFDLSGIYEEGENELGLKILSLHGLLKIIMGEMSPSQAAILDRALITTYKEKGITTDPKTQTKEPPIMDDLYNVLSNMKEPEGAELALRLEKFTRGSLAELFNQQSNFDIKNPLTVFSIKALEEELRPIAMHIVLDFVWTKVRKTLKKRLLVLDEAWYIMKYQDSASFVYGVAKRARKYYLALTTATQDVADFLSTDYGKAVLSNSSLQILLKQSPTTIDLVSQIFYLSLGERELLLSSAIGEGLFFAGQSHVAIKIVAAPFEHEIITSNPQELLKRERQRVTSEPPILNQT